MDRKVVYRLTYAAVKVSSSIPVVRPVHAHRPTLVTAASSAATPRCHMIYQQHVQDDQSQEKKAEGLHCRA